MQIVYALTTRKLNLSGQNWTLNFYNSSEKYLFNDDSDLLSQLEQIAMFVTQKNIEMEFRHTIEVQTMKYLLGVYPQDKCIYLATHQLSNELTLIRYLQSTHSNESEFEALKGHVNKIASIPVEEAPCVIDLVAFKYGLSSLVGPKYDKVYQRTLEIKEELVEKVGSYKASLFEKFSDFGLDLTANYMLVRIHMLKFLAILPSLDHDKSGTEVKKTLIETFERFISDFEMARDKGLKGQMRALPPMYLLLAKLGLKVFRVCPANILAALIRKAVEIMAKRFIAGESISSASSALKSLTSSGRDYTIDQLGELVVSNKEADEYLEKVLEIILGMGQHNKAGTLNGADIPRSHISIKVSALSNDFKPYAYEYTKSQVAPRLKKILLTAKEQSVFVNIDAEHYSYRDIVFEIYKETLLENSEFSDYADTGIVIQAYLRDCYEHFHSVIELARKRKLYMPIRLVKGAYWDAETIEADAHNFNAPEFLNKEETDIHYRQILEVALQSGDCIKLAVASHNLSDHSYAEALREVLYPNAPTIEHQCLHMTYEALSNGLAKMGWPTRNYIPVGNLLVGMAYLVRRIMENSSQVGILTIMRSHKKNINIKGPLEVLRENQLNGSLNYDLSLRELTRNFKNIYPIRPYLKSHLSIFLKEYELYKKSIKEITPSSAGVKVHSSSHPSLTLGSINYDTKETVDKKIEQLFEGFNSKVWEDNRFFALLRFGELMLENRESLSALIMFEAGKTMEEAFADVDEAVDFVNFYVREQVELHCNGEVNSVGVIGVIAPWNFPLAIPCGMTVAALVAGNPVVLKPAEQTPLIALRMVELAYQAGVPENILQLVNGEAEVGAAIVSHDLICGVVFTGSVPVGKLIYNQLKTKLTDQRYPYSPRPKFAITEMGGKNAIIVTNNCEMDETVDGIIYSAFAHAGQKCSACSRIIIDNEIKDSFIDRFVKAVKDIHVGPSTDFGVLINPLISKEDQLRVKAIAKEACQEAQSLGGKILIDRSKEEYEGYNVGPCVVELPAQAVLKGSTVASREIFGPVIHVVGYDQIDEAVELFNSTNYALTGGIFAQSQDDINYLMERMESGNIYINRPNTGARVAIEPFGGFKMSGTGPKAGSSDYLRHFNMKKPNMVESTSMIFTQSEQYLFPKNSALAFRNRREKIYLFLEELCQQFEVMFGSVNEIKKEKVEKLRDFILSDAADLPIREFPNRYIPGQLSFNKRDLGAGETLLIVGQGHVCVESFIYMVMSLLVGNGVLVGVATETAKDAWEKLVALCQRHGISNFNLSLVQTSKEMLIPMANEDFKVVLLEKSLVTADVVEYFGKHSFDGFMRKVIVTNESLDMDLDEVISDVTLTRAYAVNTMRHGAPLELTF